MQCSIALERDRARGNKMKTNSYKNPYRKESNLDNIVDQLCTRLQDIKDQESASRVGMPTCTLEHSEAVRRYYAAFPALSKREESPLQYYLPPPAWCRPPAAMHENDWHKNKKLTKERRNSYHGPKKSKKRYHNYSRSLDAKHGLPEWVTSEGVWDMDAQDPVKEFIRALALDEGYGTAENTLSDEPRPAPPAVPDRDRPDWDRPDWDHNPDWDDWLLRDDLQPRALTPMDEELYAKFEAKFDRSLEALWAAPQPATPDDEYQELPIDFHELLSSPSDRSVWGADALRDRLEPLQLADPPPKSPPAPELESFALYSGDEIYEALSTVAGTLRSLTAINHSRERSGFVEVPPRRGNNPPPPPPPLQPPRSPPPEREDLLTSTRTHFRPIRREADSTTRYDDGDSFDIRGDLEPVEFRRSARGGAYFDGALYLEYRTRSIDYGRMELTPAQRTTLDEPQTPRFRLRFPVRQRDAAVQTERDPPASAPPVWGACDDCGATAKKMRPVDIWSAGGCEACNAVAPTLASNPPAAPPPDELSREWEELLSDISAAHAEYARGELLDETLVSADRKRRHSAALRQPPQCSHPHARFLHCCAGQLDRPLTR